ncbi:hypothetical protein BDV32DRAFT_90681 [Aspergillus pseudonomiae]|nr:hypothetical protein BDV32DRAFT_90681 [Aspergillus pseudonomiae]
MLDTATTMAIIAESQRSLPGDRIGMLQQLLRRAKLLTRLQRTQLRLILWTTYAFSSSWQHDHLTVGDVVPKATYVLVIAVGCDSCRYQGTWGVWLWLRFQNCRRAWLAFSGFLRRLIGSLVAWHPLVCRDPSTLHFPTLGHARSWDSAFM